MQSKKLVGGFTLIEVLVAVLVLAIGVLGAAGSQLAALRARHGTGLMSSSVHLAGALAERMRANPAQMQAPDSLNPYLQLDYDALAGGAPAAPAVLCFAGAACSAAQMAAFDLYEIKQALHEGFPGGRVTVCRDRAVVAPAGTAPGWACAGGAGAPIVIKLGWRAAGAGSDGGAAFAPSVAVIAGGIFSGATP